MFESMYILAYRYVQETPTTKRSAAEMSGVTGWVGVQGFLAGLVFSILGLAAVAFFSSEENRSKRTGWALVGAVVALVLFLIAV